MSNHRPLGVQLSRVRREADQASWEPTEEIGMPVMIRSDKGADVVYQFLKKRYANVAVKLVWEVVSQPGFSDYYFRVW